MTFAQVRDLYGVRSWRVVKGFKNYRVTSCGRVWSCNRKKFVRQDYNISTYLRVELYRGKGRTWFFVHRLVACHYKKNSRPKIKSQVNHIDHDRHNNNAGNLEHVTPSVNMIHARRKHSDTMIYKGRGRWIKLSYEEGRKRSGLPF